MIVNKELKITWQKIKKRKMFLKVTSEKVEITPVMGKNFIPIVIQNSLVYSEKFLRDYYIQQTSEQITLF